MELLENKLALINCQIGLCLNYLSQPTDALNYFNQALFMNQKNAVDVDTDRILAKTYRNIVVVILRCIST